MAESAASMNIYQKLDAISKPVDVLKKNKKGYGYTYVTEDAILACIKGLMHRYSVSLIPHVVPGTIHVQPYPYQKTKATKDGQVFNENVNEVLVWADMEWHWINNENPDDRIIVPWTMVGQQSDASQAFGSGLSYSSRYFLLKYFNVSTTDEDPDNWRSKQREAEEREQREAAVKILEEVDSILQQYLAVHADRRDDVTEIVKRYAKDKAGKACANYHLITDPVVASKLLNDVIVLTKKED